MKPISVELKFEVINEIFRSQIIPFKVRSRFLNEATNPRSDLHLQKIREVIKLWEKK